MMTRFPGNTAAAAKNFSMRRRQYRDFSSMGEKDVAMGDMELFVNNVAGLFFKRASGIVFALGSLTAPGVAENVKKHEEVPKENWT